MKLFTQIFTLVLIAFAATLLFNTVYTARNHVSHLEKVLLEKQKSLGSIYTSEIKRWQNENKWPFMALNTLQTQHSSLFWWIAKEDGTIYLANDIRYAGKKVSRYFESEGLEFQEPTEQGNIRLLPENEIYVYSQSFSVGHTRWSFWYGTSSHEIHAVKTRIYITSFIAAVFCLSFLALLLYLIISYALRPVRLLNQGLEVIGKGDLGYRFRQIPPGELGEVAKSINNMAQELEERERAHERANQALVASEKKYRTLFQKSVEAIFVVDKNTGRYLEANSAAELLTGRSVSELTRLRTKDLTPQDADQRLSTIRSVDGTMEFDEVVYVRPDGTERIARLSTVPLDEDTIYGIAYDITEQKKLQKQLLQAQKMESVGRLAGGVAHDYNNMLSVILGYTEIAQMEVDPSHPINDHLRQIQDAAERSAAVTRQLLAFARKQTAVPKVLDLNEVVASMIDMLQRLIGEDIDLVWSPGDELWPVKLDPVQVDQILANLSVNARDAISGVGRLVISTGKITLDESSCSHREDLVPGEYVLLSVSDDGCGMDKKTMDNLFEPFFTTKDVDKGTGLGMSTVYGIVKQNNGLITIQSELGQGTTICIYLPHHTGDVDVSVQEKTSVAGTTGNETILLVEDEPGILTLTARMLEGLGYRVIKTARPGEAVNLGKQQKNGRIHLLMTDVVMPEMNGRDLAETLQSMHPGIKTLFLSGYTAHVIAPQGVLEEGVHFLQKPFSRKDLSRKVREALEDAPEKVRPEQAPPQG